MFEVRVTADFSAAHFLRDYNGKCENLHGHNYKVYAHVRGTEISEEEAMKLIGGISENKSVIRKEKFWYWATVVNAATAGGLSVGCIDADSTKELGAFGIPAAIFFLGAVATNRISAHYEKKSLQNYNDYVEEYNKRIANYVENITE